MFGKQKFSIATLSGYPGGQFSASRQLVDGREIAGFGGTNIESPLATASWTGAVNTLWSNAGSWTAGGPPGSNR